MRRAIVTSCLALGLALPAWAAQPLPKPTPVPATETPKADAKQPKVEEPRPKEEENKEEEAPAPRPTPRPALELILSPGEAHAVPMKKGVAFANGGVIDVTQPNPTTIVVTMSGLTATNADLVCKSIANYQFDLSQCFEVCFNSRRVKLAKLTMEGRVIGLLRTDHRLYTGCLKCGCGTAETHAATAVMSCGPQSILSLSLPSRVISCCDDLSVYNHEGPFCAGVLPGHYTLHETWGFGTTHPAFFCRAPSAEFSPEPHYCPEAGEAYWFSHFHPFNGLASKDFGYQVTIKLSAD